MNIIPLDEIVLQTSEAPLASGQSDQITLRQIFRYLAEGKNDKAIFRADPRIRPETIELGRIYLAANYPHLHRRLPPPAKFRLLIDENLSPKIKKDLPACFEADHVSDLGLTGEKDKVVLPYALNNYYDAVLTCDKRMKNPDTDLTLIALRYARDIIAREQIAGRAKVVLNEMTKVLHFVPSRGDQGYVQSGQCREELREVFNRHSAAICAELNPVVSPISTLTLANGVTPGKTYAQLVTEGWSELEESHPRKRPEITPSRIVQWQLKWRREIERNHQGKMSREEQVKLDAMLADAARLSWESLGRPYKPDFLPPGHLPP